MRFNKLWVTAESQNNDLNQIILGPNQAKNYPYLEADRNTIRASDRFIDLY